MTTITDRRPRPGRLRRALGLSAAALLALGVGVASLALLALETAPGVTAAPPPDAEAAALTRDLAGRLRDVVETGAAAGRVAASEAELDAALASAQRLVPGLAGEVRVEPGRAVLDLALGAPRLPEGLWLNLHLAVPASGAGLEIDELRVGRLPLPGALAPWAGRVAADRLFGAGTGAMAEDLVAAVETHPPEVALVLDGDEARRSALFDRLRQRFGVAGTAAERARIRGYLEELHVGPRRGLSRRGTVVPWLGAAVAAVPDGAAREEVAAALLALALYCGDPRFELAAGMALPEKMAAARNRCKRLTLGGREDLRQHFMVSAGLHAASTGGAVAGIGELKELLDSNAGGSGFSFDDMAANAAGVRFAEAMLDASPEARARMLARLEGEADILPPLDGLPAGLAEEAFRARYRDVDSPAYAALIEEIDRRVAALPLYRE